MIRKIDKQYISFASKISFFEFIQTEFDEADFEIGKYKDEIDFLAKKFTIEKLTRLFKKHPKSIDIFEEVLQLKRFTNTQYTHFCFDVNVLNNYDENAIINHAKKLIFKFENGKDNKHFVNLYKRNCKKDNESREEFIFFLKRTIISYLNSFLNAKNKDKEKIEREVLYEHLENSIGSRLRLSRYLIENLNADKIIKSIDLKKYLEVKRHPKDTKSIHGNFGKMKIERILEDIGMEDIGKILAKTIPADQIILPDKYKNKFCYITERIVHGIVKRKNKKPKVFDFILFFDRKPLILIETNFFSTTGTKIGINRDEYTDLKEDIQTFCRKKNIVMKFVWITDGNYWLTKTGENMYKNLRENYFTADHEILNYNLLKANISKILQNMKQVSKAKDKISKRK